MQYTISIFILAGILLNGSVSYTQLTRSLMVRM